MTKLYVVSTDRVIIMPVFPGSTLEWVTSEQEERIASLKNSPFRSPDIGEYLYWNSHARTMTGVVEDAEVFDNTESAEGAAFVAAAFDPNLAGHLHVTEKDVAFQREKTRIEARAKERAQREEFAKHRFKLGGGEGGGI